MRRIIIAAGALALGTSTLALAADTDKQAVPEAKLAEQAAYVGWDKPVEEPKLTGATFAHWEDPGAKLRNAALASADDPVVRSKLALASAEAVAKDQTGMGGPYEEVAATTTADLAPPPAAHNYPPCDPGPGDDRCIQLYEPGVRAELAAWNRPTGGLIDHAATTAMGGPFEPAEDDVALAAVADPDTAAAVAHHGAHQGLGGPLEAQSGYPPCEPGPGDDRCIQLYEPGVTGAGN